MKNRIVLGALALSLAACKKDPAPDAKNATTSPKSTVAATEGVDDVFREDIMSDIANLNFLTENELTQDTILSYVYESLLDHDPETFEFAPLLAKSYEVSKDGLSFTFVLDENAKWFDGQPVTSADVAFTLETMLGNKLNSGVKKAVYGSLDPKVQIIDEHKFTIRAKTKHFKNLELASSFQIVPKHILEKVDPSKGPMLEQTFGSGPYMLDEWKKGEKITLKKNPNYWGANIKLNQGAHNFAKHMFRIVREPKIAIELLKEGLFSDYSFTAEQWERDAKDPKIQERYDTYDFTNKAPKGYNFVAWNNAIEPFKSKNVRVALSYLLNRKFMIDKFQYGHALPSTGPIASTSDYAPKDVKPYDFDPAKAVQILNAEGWKDTDNDGVLDKGGKKLEFTIMFSNPEFEKYLTVYKEDLAKAGVVANLKKVDWTTFVKLLDDRKFEGCLLGWTASVDPDLYQIWHSDSIKDKGSNFVSYKNPKVDKLLVQAQQEFDRAKRIALNQELSRLISEDAPYTFFLERPINFVAARKGIKRPKDYMAYALGSNYWLPPAKPTAQ